MTRLLLAILLLTGSALAQDPNFQTVALAKKGDQVVDVAMYAPDAAGRGKNLLDLAQRVRAAKNADRIELAGTDFDFGDNWFPVTCSIQGSGRGKTKLISQYRIGSGKETACSFEIFDGGGIMDLDLYSKTMGGQSMLVGFANPPGVSGPRRGTLSRFGCFAESWGVYAWPEFKTPAERCELLVEDFEIVAARQAISNDNSGYGCYLTFRRGTVRIDKGLPSGGISVQEGLFGVTARGGKTILEQVSVSVPNADDMKNFVYKDGNGNTVSAPVRVAGLTTYYGLSNSAGDTYVELRGVTFNVEPGTKTKSFDIDNEKTNRTVVVSDTQGSGPKSLIIAGSVQAPK